MGKRCSQTCLHWFSVLVLQFALGTAIRAQENRLYEVEGYPELTRSYSRFSDVSVMITKGSLVKIRRQKSGLISATLILLSSHQGADSNTKTLGIGVLGAPLVESGDSDLSAAGTHSWAILDNKIRTRYENALGAGGMRFVDDKNSITGRSPVTDYYFHLTPAQMLQFSNAKLVEIATSEGTIIIDSEGCSSAKAILKWYYANTPSRPKPSPGSPRKTKKKRV
jgi:hypothetical protein